MMKICKDEKIECPYAGKKMWFIALIFVLISACVMGSYHSTLVRYVLIVLAIIALILLANRYKKNNKQ